jgi:REP element-mobilizing transposase RayT
MARPDRQGGPPPPAAIPYNSEAVDHAIAYFITFTTYGSHLHGDKRGSVLRKMYPEPLEPDAARVAMERKLMTGPPVRLDEAQRDRVASTISDVCAFKGWVLHALNVRTNHVHLVVSAGHTTPESVMNTCKAWATRRLRENNLVSLEAQTWTRHGSTLYVRDEAGLERVCGYVIEMQGEDIGGVRGDALPDGRV